jgi:hypothetical protein
MIELQVVKTTKNNKMVIARTTTKANKDKENPTSKTKTKTNHQLPVPKQ